MVTLAREGVPSSVGTAAPSVIEGVGWVAVGTISLVDAATTGDWVVVLIMSWPSVAIASAWLVGVELAEPGVTFPGAIRSRAGVVWAGNVPVKLPVAIPDESSSFWLCFSASFGMLCVMFSFELLVWVGSVSLVLVGLIPDESSASWFW